MAASATVLAACSGGTPAEQVELLSTTSAGDQPWTDRLLPPQTPVTVPAGPPDTALPDGSDPILTGDRGGLYGGSLDRPLCDTGRLVDSLESDPVKLSAWSSVQGVSDVRGFVAALTPVLLRADTRVTSYGYDDGRARAHDAVLESGTIVLIDEYGEPKVRCAHGDPLDRPTSDTVPDPNAVPWPGFDPNRVVQIRPALGPLGAVSVVDLTTGALTTVPVGTGTDTGTTPPATTQAAVPETTVDRAPQRALANTPAPVAPPPAVAPAPAPAPAPEPAPAPAAAPEPAAPAAPAPAPAPAPVAPRPAAPPPELRLEVPGLPPLVIPLPN